MNADLSTYRSDHNRLTTPGAAWPRETGGLPAVRSAEPIELADGEQLDLRIAPVRKNLGGATVRMLAYNGSIPGPTLRVQQGSSVTVNALNEGDLEATEHWHGLRLDDRYDGTAQTQRPMPVGERFTYRLSFPDHPMHHPFHIHGAGRFLILARDRIVEPNLVWKDTVLVTKGEVVDILLEVTNPGIWMAHCHIAEHHESGMMLSFRVDS